MNTTTRFFQTKEQYLAFRKAFASGQTDKRAHKSYTDGSTQVWDSQTRKYSTVAIKLKKSGWMTSAHYLLFNLVTGRNYYNGFSPKTKSCFVKNGGDADRGLNEAITELAKKIEDANNLLIGNRFVAPSYVKDKAAWIAEQTAKLQNRINIFLEPLGGVFTLKDLARVQLPSFPGCGTDVAGKKITYRELFGEQIVDQAYEDEELIETIATALAPPAPTLEPKKKSLFGRIVGALS